MNIFKQFCEDNTAVWLNNEGQAKNPEQIFAKDLLSYIRHLDELENRPTETIMWIERSGEEPKLQLVFDEFRIKIEQNSSQSFIRVLGKPWCCRDSREEECGHAASGDPAVRKVINKIFACFYLDRNCQGSVAKNYNWNVFLQNDGLLENDFAECEYMIRQSFLQEQENDQSCPDLGAEELLFGLKPNDKRDLSAKLANETDVKKNIGKIFECNGRNFRYG